MSRSEQCVDGIAKGDCGGSSRGQEDSALADFSHELRTPLAAIKGYADIIVEEYGDNQDLVEISNSISVATLHMLELVNEFLDLSKLEAGHERANISEFDLDELLTEVSRLAKPSIQRAQNTFSVEPLEQPTIVWTDRSKLRQILLNLLSNAAKFTSDGDVHLRAFRQREDPSRLILEVEDTGVGIDAPTRRKLFSRYGQSAKVQTKVKSSGLGLFLTAQFVKLLDGRIEVESEPGLGSLFRVALPDVFIPQTKSESLFPAHSES